MIYNKNLKFKTLKSFKMPKINIKFQKFDKFQNPVFIATKENNESAYEKLVKYHKKLEKKNYDTFLPIFAHPEHSYATIRFYKNRKYTDFVTGATYSITFDINMKEKNGNTYVNCNIKKCKFKLSPKKIDFGSVLDLDLDDSDLDDASD